MKCCPKCGQSKPLDGFGVRKRSPTGRKSWCRACESQRQQERYHERLAAGRCVECGRQSTLDMSSLCTSCLERRARHRVTRKASGRCAACGGRALTGRTLCQACVALAWARRLAKRRGITEASYHALLERQARRCAICSKACGTGRRLAVDHDHVTGRVRGLLCFRCNTSLARYEEYATQFAAYLAGATISWPDPVV
jgi:recombination endonuclease VII